MLSSHSDSVDLTRSTALLVVDAQDSFIATLADKDAFLRRIAFTIEAAQTLGIRTLFTEQAPEKLGPTKTALMRKARHPKVFSKKSFSALSAPGIESYLRDKEIYHVLVSGLETPICIYQTALQSVDEDIDATFLSDALGCRRTEDGRLAIEAIRQLDCKVLPSESVFYSLLGSANHPRFRAFTKLVARYSNPNIPMAKILEEPVDSNPDESDSSVKAAAQESEKKPQSGKRSIAKSAAKKRTSRPKKKVAKKKPTESGKKGNDPHPKKRARKNASAKKAARKQVAKKAAKRTASNA